MRLPSILTHRCRRLRCRRAVGERAAGDRSATAARAAACPPTFGRRARSRRTRPMPRTGSLRRSSRAIRRKAAGRTWPTASPAKVRKEWRAAAALERSTPWPPRLPPGYASARSQRIAQRRRIDRLETILQIAAQWNQTHEMEPLLAQMAEAATRLLQAPTGPASSSGTAQTARSSAGRRSASRAASCASPTTPASSARSCRPASRAASASTIVAEQQQIDRRVDRKLELPDALAPVRAAAHRPTASCSARSR